MIKANKYVFFRSVFALLLVLMTAWYFTLPENRPVTGEIQAWDIIIDPGHGGADGGAVSQTGICEAPINLKISLKTRDILAFFGCKAYLTRQNENSLDYDSAKTIRQNKSADLHARLRISEALPGVPFISVHQNKFDDPKYRGAQVFWSQGSPLSRELAFCLQETLVLGLDSTNQRVSKAAPEGVFLMDKAVSPAVTVECGFLSNPREAELLSTDIYQTKTALAVSAGCLKYLNR